MTNSAALSVIALILFLDSGILSYAQSGNSGTIRGTVLDPTGASIPNATVEILNPVSQYAQTAKTDSQGNFDFTNLPFNNYHLTASANGFQSASKISMCDHRCPSK